MWFIKTLILVFFLIYIFLIFWGGKYLEGFLTFPGVGVNTLEHTGNFIAHDNLNFQEINILFEGKNINGLFLDAGEEYTVYYLHGNGGDLTYFYSAINKISSLGYNVLAVDYPGYGKTEGFPLRDSIIAYVSEFYDNASKKYNLSPEKTILWWYSIGTWVALEYEVEYANDTGKNFYKIILEAAYTSRYDLSRYHYWFAVQKLFFLPNSFVSKENILKTSTPILLLHGEQDELIPYSQGEELFSFRKDSHAYFIGVPEGDHFNLMNFDIVINQVQEFLKPGGEILSKNYLDSAWVAAYFKEKNSLENRVKNLDLSSDDSLQKYVDPNIPFWDLAYIPENLVSLDSEFIIDAKWNAQLRQVAAENLQEMAAKFYEDMWEKMVVVSSYRSYAYQAGIKARGCPDNLCAKAGYSEHQSALAVDLWSASTQSYWNNSTRLTKFYAWLSENAHLYGFHNSYQNGLKIDGYDIEPWHWRYVWIDLASYLRENEITFAQYYQMSSKE